MYIWIMAIYLSCSIALIKNYVNTIERTLIGAHPSFARTASTCGDCSDEPQIV